VSQLSKYHRPEVQYSANESKFLATDAPLSADSIYSGQLTHLNLARVHTLESKLAELHELLVQSHALLATVAASTAPQQMQLSSFLQRNGSSTMRGRSFASASASTNDASPTLRLHTLLDSLRASAFELQSLGVLLPSHTAFPNSHQAPLGSEREWNWIFAVQQALKKRSEPNTTSSERTEEEECLPRSQSHAIAFFLVCFVCFVFQWCVCFRD
jgi:hypothetical protein